MTAAPDLPRFPLGCHPLDQAHYWCPKPLYPWAKNAMRAVAEPFSRVAMACVNESGKTFSLGPTYIMSVATAFPGARCFCMSRTVSQTRDQMFEPMRLLVDAIGGDWSYTISTHDMKISHANGSVIKFYSPSDPDNVEGYHSGPKMVNGELRWIPVAYWTDEDKGRDDEIFYRILRINPYFWLSTSSAGKAQGFFFNAINPDSLNQITAKEESGPQFLDAHYPDATSPVGMKNYFPDKAWQYRDMVSRDRCPHLITPDAIARFKAEEEHLGKNHPTVRAKRDCTFSVADDQNLIFEQKHIEAMIRAMRGQNTPVAGDVRFSADVGGEATGDDSVVMGRVGSEIVFIRDHWTSINEIDRADEWVDLFNAIKLTGPQLTIDGGGIGATVAKYMEQKREFWGIVRFNSNNNPHESNAFKDRYTELHWLLRELLELNVLKLPYCEKLLRDMRERSFIEVDDGRCKTQPKSGAGKTHKSQHNHSPNHLDALIYLLADFPMDALRRGKSRAVDLKHDDGAQRWDYTEDGKTRGGEAFGGLPVLPNLAIKI